MAIAKDFNEHTAKGNRIDMSDAAYKIWARTVLKKIIDPKYFIMVSQNFSELEVSYSNRHNFGVIVDGILDIMSEDNEGINIGCRVDDLIKNHLPELYRVRNSGAFNGAFAGSNQSRSRVKINDATVFAKKVPDLNTNEILVSLGKLSSLRWETMAYIKSGATRGTNFGTLTDLCLEQVEKMNEIVASVLGDDPSILDPGYFSKLFRKRFIMH